MRKFLKWTAALTGLAGLGVAGLYVIGSRAANTPDPVRSAP
jgi:hypothetical protein